MSTEYNDILNELCSGFPPEVMELAKKLTDDGVAKGIKPFGSDQPSALEATTLMQAECSEITDEDVKMLGLFDRLPWTNDHSTQFLMAICEPDKPEMAA